MVTISLSHNYKVVHCIFEFRFRESVTILVTTLSCFRVYLTNLNLLITLQNFLSPYYGATLLFPKMDLIGYFVE